MKISRISPLVKCQCFNWKSELSQKTSSLKEVKWKQDNNQSRKSKATNKILQTGTSGTNKRAKLNREEGGVFANLCRSNEGYHSLSEAKQPK